MEFKKRLLSTIEPILRGFKRDAGGKAKPPAMPKQTNEKALAPSSPKPEKPTISNGSVRGEFLGLGFGGFHKVSYQEWDNAPNGTRRKSKPPLICVHGLTRNSHDFDKLALRLSQSRRVICPDVAGRGQSDWLVNSAHYDNLQYNADMNALISRLASDKVDWLGTSMGGLIGMMLASANQNPIRRLILNDIGPYISFRALKMIGDYVGRSPEFDDVEEVETYLREIHAEFAPMSDEDCTHMAVNGVRELESGKLMLNYDQKIGDPLRSAFTGVDINLWSMWDMIKCPVLVIRGEKSNLLTKEITDEMTERGPGATVMQIENAGHAPMFTKAKHIDQIKKWLDEN